MAKDIRQFRFYKDDDAHNQPNSGKFNDTITYANLISGSIFFAEANLGSITQLGIQALPGTRFYVNNGVDPIIIGSTGIYELDLEGVSEITALSFDQESVDLVRKLEGAYIIVDAIYNNLTGE